MSDFALSEAEFRALYERVRRTSAWGPGDRLGTLNNISPAEVVAAASDVRDGRTVSLAAPIETRAAADNPDPAVHQMTSPADDTDGASGLSFAADRLAMNIHGNADSHIDALCHVIFDGKLYNGFAATPSPRRGRPSSRSTSRARGLPAVACCLTSRGCAGCRGWNRVIT